MNIQARYNDKLVTIPIYDSTRSAIEWKVVANSKIGGVSSFARDLLLPMCVSNDLPFGYESLDMIAKSHKRDVAGLLAVQVELYGKVTVEEMMSMPRMKRIAYMRWAYRNPALASNAILNIMRYIVHGGSIPQMLPAYVVDFVKGVLPSEILSSQINES